MNNLRIVGYTLKDCVTKHKVQEDSLAQALNISLEDLYKVYEGRAILSYPQIKKAAALCKVSPLTITSGNEEEYASKFIHCMNDFEKSSNREKILDILYDYLDVFENVHCGDKS